MAGLKGILNRIWNGAPGRGPSAWDAGRRTKKDPDFVPLQIGPNGLAEKYLDLARRRCRELTESDPLIQAASQIWINNIAGDCGIMSQAATQWEEFNKRATDLWYEYWEGVDLEHEMSGAEQQRQLLGEIWAGGDCLRVDRIAPAWNGFPQGPSVELFSAEQLDQNLSGPATGRGQVRLGVETDSFKRRIAYHVYKEHPSDGGFQNETARISSSDATLCMLRRRPGQLRGVPVPIAVVETIREQQRHKESNMALAAAAAMFGLYFPGIQVGQLTAGDKWPIRTPDGRPLVSATPGMIGAGPKESAPTVIGSNIPGPSYPGVQKILAQHIASPLGVGYTEMTGDYGDATFSSERARSLALRKNYRPVQAMLGHYWSRPTYRAFIRWHVTFGELRQHMTSEQRSAWETNPRLLYARYDILPGWEWVNPQQEAQAAEIEIALGVRSVAEVCAQRGKHWQDVLEEQIRIEKWERDARAKAGLEPRKSAPVRGSTPEDRDKGKREEEAADLHRERAMRNGHANGDSLLVKDS